MQRYIKNYLQFIVEQDLAMDPLAAQQAPAPKKDKPLKFIFLDDLDQFPDKVNKFPDGSYEFNFSTYSVMPRDLENWTKKNIIPTDSNNMTAAESELRQNNINRILKGEKINISKEDIPFIDKLKSSVSTDIFGNREADTHVIFTKDHSPRTEQIDVTFIKYKK